MKKNKPHNIAFIDGQNLYRGLSWHLDYRRFRIYLRDKYHIEEAYYFVWFESEVDLYYRLQKEGFIIIFNRKWETLRSNKKWNVDVNLTFHMMRSYIEESFDQIVLVSWDGDYKPVIDYLIEKWKFLKVLAPNPMYCSSLYNKVEHLPNHYLAYVSVLRQHLEYIKKGLPKH